MFFVIDVDNDITSSFHWYANGYHSSKQIISLSDAGELQVGGAGSTNGQITIYDPINDAGGPVLIFNKARTNVAGGDPGSIFDASDNDALGSIQFKGYDDGTPSEQIYAGIHATIADATSGQEAGKLSFYVAQYDGASSTAGLVLDGDTDADEEIDVTIGAGIASTTTIAGDAVVSGNTLTIGHDDEDVSYIKKVAHSDGGAGRLYIQGADATAGQTDKDGGPINFYGGRSTGTGDMGSFTFYAGREAASTGTSLNNSEIISKLESIGSGTTGSTRQRWMEGGGMSSTDYFQLSVAQHGATTLSTVDAATHLGGSLTLDADGDISLDAYTAKDIFFKENGTERFQFHLDATPTMEVTGSLDLDCSGDIELNADNGTITLNDDAVTMAKFTTSGIEANRKFTVTGATHFEHQGDVLYFGSGSTTQGNLCYLKEDGSWGDADADGAATGDDADRDAMGMLAIALGTDPDVDGMFIKGIITMNYDCGDVGNPLYVKTTAGAIAFEAPSTSGEFVRVVGYCLDDTNGQIYFNPDNTWVEIA